MPVPHREPNSPPPPPPPLVFLAVINDAVKSENPNVQAFKYVDDLTIVENQSIHEVSDLQGVLEYVTGHIKMRLNIKKNARLLTFVSLNKNRIL